MIAGDILHVTNGDAAAEVMRRAGIAGAILPWRDVLHEGPVPAGLSLDELRPVRAGFIAGAGWGGRDEVHAEFAARDRALAGSRACREVVLWFEHDLYDQLQLLQLLDWFAARDLGTTRLTLVCDAEYLGSSTPERIAERFPGRHDVSPAALQLARTAWAAFRAPDPRGMEDLLRQDTTPLPFLRAALRRHLQQFPAEGTGLSRSERQALEVIARGVTRLGDAYRASHHEREDPIFLGDVVFAWHLADLSRGEAPLVVAAGGQPLASAAGSAGAGDVWSTEVALTDTGRGVLDGRVDRVAVKGIDRWLGGVHLQGRSARWRWHEAVGALREHPG